MSRVSFIVWAKPGSGSRRALEVCSRLGWRIHYVFPSVHMLPLFRALWSIVRSINLIRHDRPSMVIVQIGPAAASIVGPIGQQLFGTPYILDAHSGVFLSAREAKFGWLLRRTFRNARAILIHNPEHTTQVRDLGGRAFLLEDPVPLFPDAPTPNLPHVRRPAIFLPCSWRGDEPIHQVLQAARCLPGVYFYASGKPRYDLGPLPDNFVLTGFLSPAQYRGYLQAVDAVLALTSEESISLCAAHEAIAASKPLICSDTRVLRSRFGTAAILTDTQPTSIAHAVRSAVAGFASMGSASQELRHQLETTWRDQLQELSRLL